MWRVESSLERSLFYCIAKVYFFCFSFLKLDAIIGEYQLKTEILLIKSM
jgi:hypothetical protein